MKILKDAEYQRLLDYEKINAELVKEVNRLAEKITEQTKDCMVGAWCKDCIHMGSDAAIVWGQYFGGDRYIKIEDGRIQYCKKHLHEICKEFELE